MMQKIDKIINRVITEFQNHRGKASMYCSDVDVYKIIILNVIKHFRNKRPDAEILIVTGDYDDRIKLKRFIVDSEIVNIKLLTVDYVNERYSYPQKLVIIADNGEHLDKVKFFAKLNQFVLCVLTKHINNQESIIALRSKLPDINTSDLIVTINEDRVYSPVDEHRVSVSLDKDTDIGYQRFTDYINNAVSIFGGMDVLEKCRVGDKEKNISASEYRYNLAVANGWSESIDMTSPFMAQIDAIYNPNSIAEYATNFYNFTKQRRDLVSDYYGKLEVIADICRQHSDKKILIVSVRGEFAAQVTEYINKHTDLQCGDYHDCIDTAYLTDEFGDYVLVKSGVHKGERKTIGWQAQSTLNEKRFNEQVINVLSIKNASNTKLKIACDLVILTSPMCADIVELKKRFNNIDITSNPNLLYVIYCKDTTETKKLDKITTKNVTRIISYDNENNVEFDENNGNIIL